MSTPDV